jgi:hypothetical protein
MLSCRPNGEGVVRAAVFIAACDQIDVSLLPAIRSMFHSINLFRSHRRASPHGDVFPTSIEYLNMKTYLIAAGLILAATTAAMTGSPPQPAAAGRTFSMAQEMWSTGICTLD